MIKKFISNILEYPNVISKKDFENEQKRVKKILDEYFKDKNIFYDFQYGYEDVFSLRIYIYNFSNIDDNILTDYIYEKINSDLEHICWGIHHNSYKETKEYYPDEYNKIMKIIKE